MLKESKNEELVRPVQVLGERDSNVFCDNRPTILPNPAGFKKQKLGSGKENQIIVPPCPSKKPVAPDWVFLKDNTILRHRKRGDYYQAKKQGQGGSGIVFAFFPKESLEDPVAVKFQSNQNLASIKREVRMTRRALGFCDLIEEGEQCMIIQPLVLGLYVGSHLAHKIEDLNYFGNVSVFPILRCFFQLSYKVSQALSNLHAKQMVHGDFHHKNLLLTVDRKTGECGDVKFVDFGHAQIIGEPSIFETLESYREKSSHWAPERKIGDIVQPSEDIFALGLLIFNLLEFVAISPVFRLAYGGRLADFIECSTALIKTNGAFTPEYRLYLSRMQKGRMNSKILCLLRMLCVMCSSKVEERPSLPCILGYLDRWRQCNFEYFEVNFQEKPSVLGNEVEVAVSRNGADHARLFQSAPAICSHAVAPEAAGHCIIRS